MGRGLKNSTIIKSIVDADPTVLSEDAAKAKEWSEDARTWEDVYSVRNYEYLELVVKGKEPMWDKANNKWADKAELDNAEASDVEDALTMGNNEPVDEVAEEVETVAETTKAPAKTAKKAATKKAVATDEEDTDDMPF